MDEPQPPPDWTALLDQMRAGLADFTSLAWAYYNSSVTHGFTPEQAMMLTLSWQAAIIAKVQ